MSREPALNVLARYIIIVSAGSIPMHFRHFYNDIELCEVLQGRWDDRSQDKWVFYNEDTGTRFIHRPKMMASICKRAGLKPIGQGTRKKEKGKDKGKLIKIDPYYGFHSLRHFMASFLADQVKVGTKAVSGLLRHKNLRTTEIHLHSR